MLYISMASMLLVAKKLIMGTKGYFNEAIITIAIQMSLWHCFASAFTVYISPVPPLLFYLCIIKMGQNIDFLFLAIAVNLQLQLMVFMTLNVSRLLFNAKPTREKSNFCDLEEWRLAIQEMDRKNLILKKDSFSVRRRCMTKKEKYTKRYVGHKR